MYKPLSNLPLKDLTPENDFLGIIEKGDLLFSFLNNNKSDFSKIKMFSLYGDWGSGKSTLMKYLQKRLKDQFNTFFFEAWEYENDEKLAYSLLEVLNYESELLSDNVTQEFIGNFLELGSKILRGAGKSIKLNIPISPVPGSPNIEIDPSSFVNEFSKKDLSFYESRKSFKMEFERWEDFITKGNNSKLNIVFIDDLDRCEPENVLNLLSAIKLFFTYGNKTIFFCGIDKNAVKEAIQTRYSDEVKSNEYLEKIFDISFEMPKYYDFTKFLNYYFNDFDVEFGSTKISFVILLKDFFDELKINNPRKAKKILNKYRILLSFKENSFKNEHSEIPNLIIENEGSVLETILTLFFLIVNEFHPRLSQELNSFELKKDVLIEAAEKFYTRNQTTARVEKNFIKDWLKYISQSRGTKGYFIEAMPSTYSSAYALGPAEIIKLYIAPNEILAFNRASLNDVNKFTSEIAVSHKTIQYYFLKFLIKNQYLFQDNSVSEFKLTEYSSMIKRFV